MENKVVPKATTQRLGLNEISVRTEMQKNPNSIYWNSCYAFVRPLVHSSIIRAGLSAHLEEDITQHVMEAIARNLPHFRGDCRLTTWLTKIVSSKVLDAQRHSIRSDGRWTSLNELVEDEERGTSFEVPTPKTIEDEFTTREQLREAIIKLQEFLALHKHAERNALILRLALIDDRACEEIAQQLNIDCGLVHSVVHRARLYLRGES